MARICIWEPPFRALCGVHSLCAAPATGVQNTTRAIKVDQLHWFHQIKEMQRPTVIWGSGLFFCFDIKTWGYRGTSNWWLLRERGFLRSFREQAGHTGYFTPVGSLKSHIPSIQGVLPLWAPRKAIWHPIQWKRW